MAVTGAGTLANPYILSVPADLDFIRTKLTSHYRLANDIDMSAYGNFPTIGALSPTGQRFTGTLDGMGYSIKGLKMRGTAIYTGFISTLSATAIVKNLAFIDVDIESTFSTTAIVAAVGLSGSTVENCYTSGSVKGLNRVGSMVGNMEGKFNNCFSFANLTGTDDVFGMGWLGGSTIAGVHNCHFYGTIDSTGVNGAISSVSALTLNRSTYCFYDSDILGVSNEVGTPLSTLEMKNPANFSMWSDAIWTLETGKYPYLTVLGEPVFTIPAQKVTAAVTSSITSIVSYSERIRRKIETTLTYIHPLSQSIEKELTTSCMSFIESVVSSVETKVNANVKTYEVTSSLSEITGHSTRVAKAIRSIDSHIDLIGSYITVIVPVEVEIPIYATVHFVVNPTKMSITNNKTNMYHIENRTEMKVI